MAARNLNSDVDKNGAHKPLPAQSAWCGPGARVAGASSAAESGEPHIESPVAYDAILLAGFGGPEGQDHVIPFLRNVTQGRGIPDERLEEVAHHYRHYDGISPINAQNRVLKSALEAELRSRGIALPVYWGNRNWAPYLNDAVSAANSNGHTQLLAIATSAYSSYSSCRQYREDFADALEDTELGGIVRIDKVRQFFDHPGFVGPFVEGTATAISHLASQLRASGGESGVNAADIEILFTTHSIPLSDANKSGPAERGFGDGGAYAAQHLAVSETIVAGVARELSAAGDAQFGSEDALSWQLVYQSRSGPPSMPWLEPDINDAIAALPARGVKAVVIVPIGFVSDHMEVLWDLDNEAKETAAEHGLLMARVATPGVHPDFVQGLVDLVLERLEGTPASQRPAVTELGPWYDVCRPGCCENERLGFRPALAGVQP